jgi:hypothetical protein
MSCLSQVYYTVQYIYREIREQTEYRTYMSTGSTMRWNRLDIYGNGNRYNAFSKVLDLETMRSHELNLKDNRFMHALYFIFITIGSWSEVSSKDHTASDQSTRSTKMDSVLLRSASCNYMNYTWWMYFRKHFQLALGLRLRSDSNGATTSRQVRVVSTLSDLRHAGHVSSLCQPVWSLEWVRKLAVRWNLESDKLAPNSTRPEVVSRKPSKWNRPLAGCLRAVYLLQNTLAYQILSLAFGRCCQIVKSGHHPMQSSELSYWMPTV